MKRPDSRFPKPVYGALLALVIAVAPANTVFADKPGDPKADCSKNGGSNNKNCGAAGANKKTSQAKSDTVTQERLSTRGLKPPPKDDADKNKNANSKSSSSQTDSDKPKQQ